MFATLKRTVLVCTTIGIIAGVGSSARAAHATNFLNALQEEVTNRLATATTNINAADKKALTAADKALDRNTKTFAADLGVLATAATVLNARFTNDLTFSALEEDALAAYELEAAAQIDDAHARVGTNTLPKGISKQLNTAGTSLTNLLSSSNSVPDRARELARIFNRLKNPISHVTKKYKNQGTPVPSGPFTAPAALNGKNLDLVEDAIVNDQTKFFFHSTARDDQGNKVEYFSYVSDNPEELGTWTYEKTGAKTAVVHCNPDYPYDYNENHDVLLTFTSETGGTFTGHVLGQPINGTFFINDAP